MRSVLPLRGLKGDRLPNLKPWVKVIFGIRDPVGMAVSSVQAFVLMLQMLGISYLLYSVGRGLLGLVVWVATRNHREKV